MIIIEIEKFETFEEYLDSLGKAAKKNYAYAQKHNLVHYKKILVTQNLVQSWMDLWGRQLIRGQHRQYAFTADALQGKNMAYFCAIDLTGIIAMQFTEIENGYMNCHPVMYEKEKYSKRYLSKFMWFGLIKWAIENKIKIVDMGGGNNESWQEMIRTREQYPNSAYKWMYIPQSVKERPEKQTNYKVEHYGISKRIFKID